MRKFVIALGAVGALLTLGAATGAQASVAHVKPMATPACGYNCFNLSNLGYGANDIQSAVIKKDNGTGGVVGTRITLSRATDSSPNEDFTGGYVGTVAQLCNEGQLSPYICNNYGPSSLIEGYFPVYESDWSPYGNQSGLCVGGGKTVTANETMTLQDCGVSAGTFWVADLNNAHIGYTPFLNGADTTFTHPLVLSVVSIKQGLRLRLERLNLLTGNYVPNEDMWTLTFGVEL
jgi:hypothetical protein